MTDLSQQTDQLVLWLKLIDHDLNQIRVDNAAIGLFIVALLFVIALKKR